ncbi:MAG: 3-phosphoshikimate 1-carboxyvinyltransferase, partial [Clostridia bacterium]|nr:3-phosphoshikimate 1-carboxyvinyltransferase [Clostridia bacterium]
MSSVAVSKSRINGIVEAMPSKSYAHRIMICAALCNSPVTVSGITGSDDMLATMGCLKAMGAQFEPVGIDEYIITPIKQTKKAVLDCIESGSTLRFMLAVASAVGGEYTFTGKGRLAERPNDALLSVLSTHGVCVKGNGLPLEVSGHLLPGEYVVDGAVSSQFVSGLLLAAPLTGGKVTVTVEGELKSRGYVDITVDVMKTFGVDVKVEGQSFIVEAGQKYLSPDRALVEGDWSNAAFPLALGLLCGRVEVTGLNAQSLQGDMRAIDVMRLLGGDFKNDKG